MHPLISSFTARRDLPVWARYLAATAFVALSVLVVNMLDGRGVYAPFILLIPVVMLVSILFDRGSGLYAAGLSGIAVFAFFDQERAPPRADGMPALVSLLLFVVATGFAAVLIEALYRSVAQAAKSEQQKDLMLREASHRIKNNLQTVVSLLRIQRRALRTEEARGALETALARINVMAAIHARLAGPDPHGSVEISEFLSSLCSDLRKSMVGDRPIAFEIDAELAVLDCNRAAAVGFVINELVTNALKYAFVEGRPGKIGVAFRQVGAEFELDIADDGSGIATGVRPGLGQTLIQLFAGQLHGTIERVPGSGTHHLLRFPVAGNR